MSAEIIQLNPLKNGEKAFMQCECGGDFTVVAIIQDNPIICSLLCLGCEQEIPVTNGIVGE